MPTTDLDIDQQLGNHLQGLGVLHQHRFQGVHLLLQRLAAGGGLDCRADVHSRVLLHGGRGSG